MAKGGRLADAAGSRADLPMGSWRLTLITAVLLLTPFGVVTGVVANCGWRRRASFPGHPHPPTPYCVGPFPGSDPDALVVNIRPLRWGSPTCFRSPTREPDGCSPASARSQRQRRRGRTNGRAPSPPSSSLAARTPAICVEERGSSATAASSPRAAAVCGVVTHGIDHLWTEAALVRASVIGPFRLRFPRPRSPRR